MAKPENLAYRTYSEWFALFDPAVYGQYAPERFFKYALGVKVLDPWQYDVLRAFGRGDRKIAIAACHGPGKTFLAAGLVWFMLVCRYPQNTVLTAPSSKQLYGSLWKEVRRMTRPREGVAGLPRQVVDRYSVTNKSIVLKDAPEESFAEARTARPDNPEALQGVHCEDGWVLIIADEASGVYEEIFNSARGSMSGKRCCTILLGNPRKASGQFYRAHNGRTRGQWSRFEVGYKDSSRVTEEFEQEVAAEFGRDSNEYRIRVLGKFPLSEGSVLIPVGLVDNAVRRGETVQMEHYLPQVWGLDVAGGGKHATGKNALLRRNAIGALPRIMHWGGEDPMAVAGKVKTEWDNTPEYSRPTAINIDTIGIGLGVYSRLRELGLPVRGINVSETKGVDTRRFMNLKAQLWWTTREWFETNMHTMPKCDGNCGSHDHCLHDLLREELSAPMYEAPSGGKIKVEEKRHVKDRTGLTLDLADAFILTHASEAAVMTDVSSARRWPKKIPHINYGSV